MNAFSNPQQQLEHLFTTQLVEHDFEQLFLSHVEYFRQYQQAQFSYRHFSDATARCHAPITSYENLLHYITLYGYAHFQRFRYLVQHALDHGMQLNQGNVLRITDYGCGQGIATLACLELLQDKLTDFESVEIVLIEPSELAASRAKKWLDAKIKQYTGTQFKLSVHAHAFDHLKVPKLAMRDGVALHLFSNVLDVYSSKRFDMQHLVNLTKTSLKHHYFLAISPDYAGSHFGFSEFLRYLKPESILLHQHGYLPVIEYRIYDRQLQRNSKPIHALVCYQSVEETI